MTKKRCHYFLIFACVLVWVVMMGSKNIYTAEYIEIMRIFNVNEPQATLAMTFYFFTYAIMQIFLFFIMDKLNVEWYMLISVVLSGVATVVVALATSLWQLWWVLALNGILQAGIWGMCTAVLSKYLPITMRATANMFMNIGTAIAGVISYGSASLFVSFKTVLSPFVFLGIILSISGIIFFLAVKCCAKQKTYDLKTETQTAIVQNKENLPFTLKTSKKRIIFFVLTFILSFIIHFVFYGTLNWVPNLLKDEFNLAENVAILISVLVPLATVIGPIIAIRHCEKYVNFIFVGLIYTIIACVFAFLMIFIYDLNMILSLVILMIYTIILQGVITIVFSIISYKLSNYINAGAHSGLMNAAGAFAAGISPTVIGAIISGNNGWQLSYLTIFIITLFVAIASMIILLMLKPKKKNN